MRKAGGRPRKCPHLLQPQIDHENPAPRIDRDPLGAAFSARARAENVPRLDETARRGNLDDPAAGLMVGIHDVSAALVVKHQVVGTEKANGPRTATPRSRWIGGNLMRQEKTGGQDKQPAADQAAQDDAWLRVEAGNPLFHRRCSAARPGRFGVINCAGHFFAASFLRTSFTCAPMISSGNPRIRSE